MIDSIHDVLARVHRIAKLDVNIVSTADAMALSREIALLRSEHGAALIRAEEAEAKAEVLSSRLEAAIVLIDGHDGADARFAEHWKWAEVRDALYGTDGRVDGEGGV